MIAPASDLRAASRRLALATPASRCWRRPSSPRAGDGARGGSRPRRARRAARSPSSRPATSTTSTRARRTTRSRTRSRTPRSVRCTRLQADERHADARTSRRPCRRSPTAGGRSPSTSGTASGSARPSTARSPPADVKYAIERGFAASVANGYVGAYFGDVVGAPAKATKAVPDITGIQTPNTYTIVFKLKQSVGRLHRARSACRVTAPVPPSYARPFDAQDGLDLRAAPGRDRAVHDQERRLGQHQRRRLPAGQADRRSSATRTGTRRRAGGRPTPTRSCSRRATRIRPSRRGRSSSGAARRERRHAASARGAQVDPRQPEQKQPARRSLRPAAAATSRSTRAKAPFNNADRAQGRRLRARRNAMRLTRGGAVDGRIATHFIDPSFGNQGFDAGRRARVRPVRTSADARGTSPMAKALLKQAGYASGMYTGPQVTMVADNTPPGSNTAQVVAADLAKIGFNRQDDPVTHATMYTKFCNVPKERAEHLPERRLAARLPRAADDPGRHLQREEHRPRQQLELAAAERPVDQRRDRSGQAHRSPTRPAGRPGAGSTRWSRARPPRSLALGELPDAVLDAGHARARAVERRRPGRDLHGRPRAPTRPSPATAESHARPPGAARREGARPRAAPRSRRRSFASRVAHARATSSAGSSGGSFLLLVVSGLTFLIFYTFPSADPAALRAGRQATPRADRPDPPPARARPARLRPVLALHQGARPPLRPRLLVPEQRLRPVAALHAAARHDLAHDRRVRVLDAGGRPRGDPLGGPQAVAARPSRRWAAR